jgi:amidase
LKRVTTDSVIHVMSKDNAPAIVVENGETLIVETAKPGIPDEVFSKDYSVVPFPKRVLTITGPIYIEGCEPGDILKVDILDIQLDLNGKMWMGQWMGILMDEVDHCFLKKVTVDNGLVHFDEEISFPVKPMIGTIGVAPAGDAIACLVPGEHGANMDALNATIGNSVYLQVQVKGGLLAIGDVHAAMGLGEVLGTGVEIGSTVTVTVSVIKATKLAHPMIESPTHYEFLISSENMLEGSKEATRTAIEFVRERNHCTFDDAYALVGQTANLKIMQVVNPIFTLSIEIPKQVLKSV